MSIRVHPWFTADDYNAIREMVGNDPYLPDTYDEWLKLATNRLAEETASGHVPNKVIVNSDKLARYCHRAGLNHDMIGVRSYAGAILAGYKDT